MEPIHTDTALPMDATVRQRRLKALGRQLERTRRADLVRGRQCAMLLKMLVESMIEFGISPGEVSGMLDSLSMDAGWTHGHALRGERARLLADAVAKR